MATNPLIAEYHKYQLQWMIAHGYSLDNLIEELANLIDDEMPDELDDTSGYCALMDAWGTFNNDIGFDSNIYCNLREWLHEEAWAAFADIPIVKADTHDSLGMAIDTDYLCYPKGTPQEKIWHDFDELYAPYGGVHALLYGSGD